MEVEADHIPPKCVFINLYKDPCYKVAKWCHEHENDQLKRAFDDDLEKSIQKIQGDQNVNGCEMCKVIDSLRKEYTEQVNKSKDLKENENNKPQEYLIKRKIAIEVCIKKNEYEMMTLERKRLETDGNKKKKLQEIKEKIKKKEKEITAKIKEKNVGEEETEKKEKKPIYDLICENGDNGACRNVLKSHHEQGITFGNFSHSQAMR